MEDKIEELQAVSMQIILHAGDARAKVADALASAKAGDIAAGRAQLEEARGMIAEAHRAQTGVIQSEADGDTYSYSVLFAHAQDTLMTNDLETRVAAQLIDIIELATKKEA